MSIRPKITKSKYLCFSLRVLGELRLKISLTLTIEATWLGFPVQCYLK